MEVKAKLKYLRISPRKTRLVVDVIRGMKVEEAKSQLKFINKLATKPIEKLLQSAIANATNNYELEESNLFVKEIKVDEGPTLKRWMPRAFGRATTIRKRTSHIDLVLGEIKDSGEKAGKKPDTQAPVKLGEKPKEAKSTSDKVSKDKKDKDNIKTDIADKGTEVHDPRGEGHGKHTKVEGKSKAGVKGKFFRRKSG